MKKYIIEDLIIDIPPTEEKKSSKNPKGKYTAAALILIALIVIAGISKMLISPTTHNNTDGETKKVSSDKDSVHAELKKDFINYDALEVADTNELPKQKYETTDPVQKTAQDVNDTLSLENNISADTAAEENNETIIDDDILAAKSEELPEANQEMAKTTEMEESADQKPLKISDILSPENSVEIPVVEEAPQPEAVPEVISEPETTSQPEAIAETTPEPEENIDLAGNDTSAPAAIVPERKTKSDLKTGKEEAEANIAKNEKIPVNTKAKTAQKSKTKQNSFFDIFSNKTKYYVQVGTNPSPTLLSKLKSAKLSYMITKNKGKYKVIVGSYSSIRSAKSSAKKIKKDMGINGVVVKIKIK